MQQNPKSVGFFLVVVLAALAIVGWPRPADDAGEVEPAAASGDSVDVRPWSVPEGYWGAAQHGVALVPPAGWAETQRQERDYLDRVAGVAEAGNFCVITLPNMFGLSFDQLVEENERAFELAVGLEPISSERLVLDGNEVLKSEYLATHQGTGIAYHCVGIVFLRGRQQVVLTMTVAEDQWPDVREEVRAAFATLVLEPRAPTPVGRS